MTSNKPIDPSLDWTTISRRPIQRQSEKQNIPFSTRPLQRRSQLIIQPTMRKPIINTMDFPSLGIPLLPIPDNTTIWKADLHKSIMTSSTSICQHTKNDQLQESKKDSFHSLTPSRAFFNSYHRPHQNHFQEENWEMLSLLYKDNIIPYCQKMNITAPTYQGFCDFAFRFTSS